MESEPPSRVVNTPSLLQVVLTNFLPTGECCLLVEVDSARTHRESQALTVLMAVMELLFHDEHPTPGGVDKSSCLEALGEAHGSRAASPSRIMGPELCSSVECTSILFVLGTHSQR